MKVKKAIGLLALAATMSFGLGMHALTADAATIYTSSEKDYWTITDGSGDYTVSLDNAATTQPSYKGVETVVTPAEGVDDIGITLKGMVNPMATTIIKHDNQEKSVAEADAIVYTFTSLSDPDRQVSVIATQRGNRSWYTLSLTDELYYKDGYTYVEGTESKTIGRQDNGQYNTIGFTYWASGEYKWGAIFEGELMFKMTSAGNVHYNDSTILGNITDANFLANSKAGLVGTKYEERYTSEYVAETLAQLAKGARMEIKWYGVKTDKVDFHIRGISGSWIGDNGDGKGLQYNLGVKHSVMVYKKTNVLYVGEKYKLSDLVYAGGFSFRNSENANAKLSLSGWYAKSVNKTAGNNGDSTWYNALTQMGNTITMNETGTYSMTLSGSLLGYYTSSDFPSSFTFEVVEKTSISYNAFGQTMGTDSAKRWTNVTLHTPTAEQLAIVPAGYEFQGWNIGGTTYAAGSTYTVNGSGEAVVCDAKIVDVQKPTISVEDYTGAYYDGDTLSLLAATVSDNSNENILASVSVTKDGEAVAVTDNQVALSAGTYTITYTASDTAGNVADAVTKTVVVKDKVLVTYSDGTNVVYSESFKPGEITLISVPAEQIPAGYAFDGWKCGEEVYEAGASYTLGETPVTFVATTKAIEYTVTLNYLTAEDETITFTIENRAEKLAEIIAKLPAPNNGYGNHWKDLPAELPLTNVTYEEVESIITYTITFAGVEGVDAITFTVETKDALAFPAVPEKAGYTGAWDKAVADIVLDNATVTAVYTAIEYTITFAGVEGVDAITFTVETKDTIELPALADKEGYTAAWDKAVADLALENTTITAVYTAIEYTATVVVNGTETVVTYTIENREAKLVDIYNMKPISDNEYYTYVWETALPEELPLENGKVYTVLKQEVERPDDSSSSEDIVDSSSSEEVVDSSSDSTFVISLDGCFGGISGGMMALVAMLGAAAMLLKKKEE